MIRKLEAGVALAVTALLVVLHALVLRNAGALWRDEANSVNLSGLPLSEFWRCLQWDSFPALWGFLLKAWRALGLGSSDLGLRALGLLVGLAILAALWRNARALGIGAPLLSLAFLGTSAAVVAYGDSVRAYGLGMLAGILTFGLGWQLVEAPSRARLLRFAVGALVSVQCTFNNALFLLAICAGAGVVVARRKDWRTLFGIVGAGMVAALSLLPYRGMMRDMEDWNAIVRWEIGPAWLWAKFGEANLSTSPHAAWWWVAAALLATLVVPLLLLPRAGLARRQQELVLFSGTTLLVGVISYVLFLLRLSYYMQPWYFLTIFALAACCLDGTLGVTRSSEVLRLARIVAVAAIVALSLPGTWAKVHERRTNLDLVAAHLNAAAVKGDFIVVNPWQCGIPFSRYYHGAAEWVTVPPVPVHDLHRYNFLKQAMQNPDVMAPVVRQLRSVIASGHRVFWVGRLMAPRPGQSPPMLPPAPQAPWGWREDPHYQGWVLQAGYGLVLESASAEPVAIASDQPVSNYEDLPVTVLERAGAR